MDKCFYEKAWMWANTRKGHWRIAHSHILHTTLTDLTLERHGLVSLTSLYNKGRL
jgi:RNA-directed DNA polymerase